MANLTNTETLDLPLNRQDLYNMWANATLGTIEQGDLAPGQFTMDVGDYLTGATSTPEPGQFYYAKVDRLAYVWHDEVDDTGVSLWLAVGPDRFDVAALAAEPIPAGAIVEGIYDKWVRTSTGASGSLAHQKALGTCAAGVDLTNIAVLETQASGTWIPMSIDGIVWGYTRRDINDTRFVRVFPESFGEIVRASNATPVPGQDDVLGLGLADRTTGLTATSMQFTWIGPRVLKEF